MKLFYIIKTDLSRLSAPTLKNFMKWYFSPRGSTFPHDVWLRVLQWSYEKKTRKFSIGIIAVLFYRHYSYKYGVHTNSHINIGEGLKIVHGDGVHLNCSSIGSNFTVYQDVTFGVGKDGIPSVEDNVIVYPGAVIVGNITLHSGCIVGANAFVNKSVPSNATVGGVPARILHKSGEET